MKRILLSMSLVMIVFVSSVSPAFAVYSAQYQEQAESLKILGVFQGTGGGFELDREPSRLEGLVMMIRMLGKETAAKGLSSQPCVFVDVPAWGIGYVNYAYQNGMTKGVGNQRFGTTDKLSAKSYVTLMLRALGYNDSQGDFSFDKAVDFAIQIKMLSNAEAASLSSGTFLRDHVAMVSGMALKTATKDSSQSLLDSMVTSGAVSGAIAEQYRKSERSTPATSLPPPSAVASPSVAPEPTPAPVPTMSPTATSSPGVPNRYTPVIQGIVIENIDKEAEVVTIRNKTAANVDLRGYILFSVTGNQSYVFPSYVLKAGASMTVASGDHDGDVKWTTANIWNNSKSDPGVLYDPNGNEVSRFER